MLKPPIAPMLAKLTRAIPTGEGWAYEPKWDGFRALIFKDGDDVVVQSRDGKPLQRYFPEVVAALRAQLPARIVLDGEVVIARGGALDFDALLLRIHPAAKRIALLAVETPASFVAWDVLALDDDEALLGRSGGERRAVLERVLAAAKPPLYLTPWTQDHAVAQQWFERFEGAGLDGVVAKRLDAPYAPGARTMAKVKHARTADVVVLGYRLYAKGGTPHDDAIGSLVLGLFGGDGKLHPVGVAGAFTMTRRLELFTFLQPHRAAEGEPHPWKDRPGDDDARAAPRGAITSRWNTGKDLSWQPLRLELVAEVAYDHLQGARFRHATQFQRWRADKQPADCRYDQLEETPPQELAALFAAAPPPAR